jgi:hypothetical protein
MRYLFVLVIFASLVSFVSAQEKQNEAPSPKAYKFAEFGKLSKEKLKVQITAFYKHLESDSTAIGCIFNYGTAFEQAAIKKRILDSLNFRKFDGPRITFIDAGYNKNAKTILWIVPAGAQNPLL